MQISNQRGKSKREAKEARENPETSEKTQSVALCRQWFALAQIQRKHADVPGEHDCRCELTGMPNELINNNTDEYWMMKIMDNNNNTDAENNKEVQKHKIKGNRKSRSEHKVSI